MEKIGYKRYLNNKALNNIKLNTKTNLKNIDQTVKTVDLKGMGKKFQGKVRDFYIKDGKRILITTDRQSAFNYNLGLVPFKGAVLNLLSRFWFDKTKKIIPNHMISIPDQNIIIAYNCEPIPIEMIVRGYLTGVTVTSPWYNYQKGERLIYGIKFLDGLRKNQKLLKPIITPTSHPDPTSGSHEDERLTKDEIIGKKIVPEKLYLQMEKTAYELFNFGTKLCQKRGLILVDTKYEFGLYKGKLMLIDEIHTPDSSRFWIADTYKKRFLTGEEPDNFDKEILRLYYVKELGYNGKGIPPKLPEKLQIDLAKRYISIYEKITGKKFIPETKSIEKRLQTIKL